MYAKIKYNCTNYCAIPFCINELKIDEVCRTREYVILGRFRLTSEILRRSLKRKSSNELGVLFWQHVEMLRKIENIRKMSVTKYTDFIFRLTSAIFGQYSGKKHSNSSKINLLLRYVTDFLINCQSFIHINFLIRSHYIYIERPN